MRVVRRDWHPVMLDGSRMVTVSRHNPVNAFTAGDIVRNAGLTLHALRKLHSEHGQDGRHRDLRANVALGSARALNTVR